MKDHSDDHLRYDVFNLLDPKKIKKKFWNAIHGSLENGRLQLKLSSNLDLIRLPRNEYKHVTQYLKDVETQVLRSVKGFERAIFTYSSLLINKGRIKEQAPHSDYGIKST